MAGEARFSDFRLSDGKGYILNADLFEAIRLNYQYFLWRESLGFDVHPSIPQAQLKSIADIGTGTGNWLLNVARELPDDARLDGFDIDLHNTPPPAWAPKNVRFHQWNFFQDPPSHLHGKYDLVHARLLVLVFDNGEAAVPAIRNMMKLLRPGGFLQWDEVDSGNMFIKKIDSSMPTPALDGLEAKSRSNGKHDWCTNLARFIEQAGLEKAVTTQYSYQGETSGWLIRPLGDQALMLMSNYAMSLRKIGQNEAADEFFDLIARGYEESVRGAAIVYPRLVVVARRSDTTDAEIVMPLEQE